MKLSFFSICLTLLCILAVPSLQAQEKNVAHQFNSWWSYGGNHKLTDDYTLHTLVSLRRNDFVSNWQQSLVRVHLGRKIYDNTSLALGVDWAVTWPYGAQPRKSRGTEYRTYEQLSFKHKSGNLATNHRYRLEQRFIGENLRHRFRYRFTAQYPLSQKFFAVFFDEVFLSFGEGTAHRYFNQNWAYLGLGYKIGNGNVKVGYMNQYLPKSDDISVESNHTLSISYGYSFDFRPKE